MSSPHDWMRHGLDAGEREFVIGREIPGLPIDRGEVCDGDEVFGLELEDLFVTRDGGGVVAEQILVNTRHVVERDDAIGCFGLQAEMLLQNGDQFLPVTRFGEDIFEFVENGNGCRILFFRLHEERTGVVEFVEFISADVGDSDEDGATFRGGRHRVAFGEHHLDDGLPVARSLRQTLDALDGVDIVGIDFAIEPVIDDGIFGLVERVIADGRECIEQGCALFGVLRDIEFGAINLGDAFEIISGTENGVEVFEGGSLRRVSRQGIPEMLFGLDVIVEDIVAVASERRESCRSVFGIGTACKFAGELHDFRGPVFGSQKILIVLEDESFAWFFEDDILEDIECGRDILAVSFLVDGTEQCEFKSFAWRIGGFDEPDEHAVEFLPARGVVGQVFGLQFERHGVFGVEHERLFIRRVRPGEVRKQVDRDAAGKYHGCIADDFVFRVLGEGDGTCVEGLPVSLPQKNAHGMLESVEHSRRQLERPQVAVEPVRHARILTAFDVAFDAVTGFLGVDIVRQRNHRLERVRAFLVTLLEKEKVGQGRDGRDEFRRECHRPIEHVDGFIPASFVGKISQQGAFFEQNGLIFG